MDVNKGKVNFVKNLFFVFYFHQSWSISSAGPLEESHGTWFDKGLHPELQIPKVFMENVGNGYVPIAFKLEPGFSKFICVAHTSLANQLPALARR